MVGGRDGRQWKEKGEKCILEVPGGREREGGERGRGKREGGGREREGGERGRGKREGGGREREGGERGREGGGSTSKG